MIKYIGILALFTLFTIACKKDRIDPLFEEVMYIHDDVMPKMSDIHELKKAIKMSKDSTTSEGIAQIKALDEADEAMMQWMYDFKMPDDTESDEVKIKYLLKEKESITEVRDKMLSAIKEASDFLEK